MRVLMLVLLCRNAQIAVLLCSAVFSGTLPLSTDDFDLDGWRFRVSNPTPEYSRHRLLDSPTRRFPDLRRLLPDSDVQFELEGSGFQLERVKVWPGSAGGQSIVIDPLARSPSEVASQVDPFG